jgi:type IV pilus assembly protein PilM
VRPVPRATQNTALPVTRRAFSRFIKLPPVEKKRIPDIVKFEARQQIPFALEEVIWAYQQIGDEDEESEEDFTMAEVGLFAMKRDMINRFIGVTRV